MMAELPHIMLVVLSAVIDIVPIRLSRSSLPGFVWVMRGVLVDSRRKRAIPLSWDMMVEV